MAHTFDTGLTRPQRTVVQDSVLLLLDRLRYRTSPTPSGYLRALVPFCGKVRGPSDEVGIDQLWDVLQGRAPAIAVGIGDMLYSPAGTGGFKWTAQLEVDVYILCNQSRSREARMVGDVVTWADDTKDPGVNVILEHVEELLVGVDLKASDYTIRELRPVRANELGSGNEQALWHFGLTVQVGRSMKHRPRDITQELTLIATTYSATEPVSSTQVTTETRTDIDPTP